MFKQTHKKGFTLIELLVVISIIGLLSSVVLSSLSVARSKGRDAQRIRDLTELRKALALYYDRNGSYPDTSASCGVWGECSSAKTSTPWNTASNPLYAVVTSGFISRLPVDPKNTPPDNVLQTTSADYSYYYSTTGNNQTYDLVARLENAGNPNSCERRGTAYCNSVIWSGWNWRIGDGGGTPMPDGDKIIYYHP